MILYIYKTQVILEIPFNNKQFYLRCLSGNSIGQVDADAFQGLASLQDL